jgi:dipeptidyl aminopeptidase/acylaminoacyl peptidase
MECTAASAQTSLLRPLFAVLLMLGLLGGSVLPVHGQDAPEIAIEIDQRVVYGEADGEPLRLDVLRPPTREAPRPAVVLLPGWESSGFSMLMQGMELAKAGYVAVTADYRADWPEFIDDAQLAVRWVRDNADTYGIDPDRICAYGWSAGGQLAAMLAVRDTRDQAAPALADYSSRVACAVDLAGPADATIPDPSPSENEWTVEHLGGTPEEVPQAYRDVSPLAFVDERSAPMLIVHGNGDGTVPVEHSRLLAAALQEAGVEVVYAELDGEGHGIVDWEVNGALTLAFLARHLDPAR